MGMAAGQARLLSITARLSDNEQNGQALSFAKQRLADEADQVNREYNEALNLTKLTVLTGFNGADAQYTDISYGLLTEYNKLAAGKQYLVTNQKGQILVTEDIKNAYKAGNGDFNKFINYFGLSQNDVDFAKLTDTDLDEQTGVPKRYQVVHDAWDKYLRSVGLSFEDIEHDYSNPYLQIQWEQNTGIPTVKIDSKYAQVTHATMNNPAVPAKNMQSNLFEIPLDYSLALIPNLGVDSTFEIKQEVDDYGNPVVQRHSGGVEIPKYLIDVENKYGVKFRYELSTDDKTQAPVFDTNGNKLGDYYQVAITAFDEDGNSIKFDVNGNPDTDRTSFGQMFGNPNSPYYNPKYDWRLNLVTDASGNFYLTGWEPIPELCVGLVECNFLNNVHTEDDIVTMSGAGIKYIPLNFEGTTKEQRELYDYAVALTQSYAVAEGDTNAILYGNDGNAVKSIADNSENAAEIQYYINIFDEMQKYGYVTEADLHINQAPSAQRANVVSTGVKDNNWFEQGLRQGQLLLKTYDASKRAFVNTTYAEDSNIQEVEDDRRIAKAQVDYDQAQEALERKDKKIDLELKKLDTEHSALQTEYESVKSVVDKNIEKSFNIFS